jgi:hypothetical protein
MKPGHKGYSYSWQDRNECVSGSGARRELDVLFGLPCRQARTLSEQLDPA